MRRANRQHSLPQSEDTINRRNGLTNRAGHPVVAIVAVGGFICQLVALSQMLADDFHHPVG